MLYSISLELEKASLANKHVTAMSTPETYGHMCRVTYGHMSHMPICLSNLTQQRRIVVPGLLGGRRQVSLHVVFVCHAVCQDATLSLHVTDRL